MPAPNANLYQAFRDRNAGGDGKPVVLAASAAPLSFADLETRSGRIAAFLTRIGAAPGDRITVQVHKSPEALCLYLACLRGGLVFQPLNMGYTESELRYFIGDAAPAVVVCDPEKRAAVERLAAAGNVGHVLTLDARGHGSLAAGATDAPDDFGVVRRDAADLAALLYSSGTTGTPKGVMLTHGNLLSNTEALVGAWRFDRSDRLLHALPIFHVHGLFVAIGCVLLSGASMRWLSGFDAGEVVRWLPECTVMMGVPTYYTRLLAHQAFDAGVCRNVRLFISGSAPLLPETFHAFEARTGHRILERYGMTETNMNTSNPVDGDRRPGTVGLPLPGVEVRVVDGDGKPLPAGGIGRLQVRGPNVFAGYWNLPDKTAEEFTADGYFETGDQAAIEPDGYVTLVGRARDLVITGGLNVYPKEVELFIDRLPGVVESAVIGVPHPDFGEAVVAVVVPAIGASLHEDEVIRAVRGELAAFKVPKRVFFVDALPRNTMSKVQKNVLRDTYRASFG